RQYLIVSPGSAQAGTRTMIFTTGGGGYFGRQSASGGTAGSEALNEAGAANGSVVMAKIAAPNIKRTSEVTVFMAEILGREVARGTGFPIINWANRVVLPKAKKPRVEMFG